MSLVRALVVALAALSLSACVVSSAKLTLNFADGTVPLATTRPLPLPLPRPAMADCLAYGAPCP